MQRTPVNFLQWHARNGDRAMHWLRPGQQHCQMTGPDAGQYFQSSRPRTASAACRSVRPWLALRKSREDAKDEPGAAADFY